MGFWHREVLGQLGQEALGQVGQDIPPQDDVGAIALYRAECEMQCTFMVMTPQKTPTIEQPFIRHRFSAICQSAVWC